MDEGRWLAADAAVVDVGAREIIRASGSDRVSFLQRLLTGDVAGTPVGGGSRSLLLNLKGHIVSDLRIFPRADEVWMVVAPGQGEPTAKALSGYAVMDDFTATVEPDRGPLAVHGPRAAERLGAAGLSVPPGPAWSHVDVDGAWVVRARALGADGLWVFADGSTRAGLARGLPVMPAGVAEALRIESGEPAWGAEITGERFPMEVGLGSAIDHAKGCYLGQEPIVRVRDRGHLNWRLARLEARDSAATFSPGDELESDARPRAGRVTSTGQRPGMPPVALVLLHASVAAGTEVRVRHGEALVPAVVHEVPATP
jgi:folate-binding protein YgfZ